MTMSQLLDQAEQHRSQAIVPGQCVRITGETARVAIPGQNNSAAPTVELVRNGDIVQAIDVTCACGRRMRLRCVY
jgi:hypothetical protein